MKSQLRGSKCHKPIKRYGQDAGYDVEKGRNFGYIHRTGQKVYLISWDIWGQYGIRNDSDEANPESGMFFWAWSKCCKAKIDNAQIIYDEMDMD